MHSRPSVGAAALLFLRLVTADTPTTESEEASITDETTACIAYGYQPVTDAIVANQFPTIWAPVADIRNDTDGFNKFLSINSSIPNIAPKGVNGVQGNITYDNAADPDCWWTQTQCVQPKASGVDADIASVPEPRTLGYGFDDGPYCGHNDFYNYLTTMKQKATMFYIGSNVLDNPLQAQRAAADGHEICVHTWSHGYMTAFSNEQAFAELWYTIKAIKLVTGYTPRCWRPPHGDVDDRIRFIAKSLDLSNVMWKYDSFDWENGSNGVTEATVKSNYEKLISDASSGAMNTVGAILLAHELNNFTMQTAVDYYPKLAAAFDYIVPIAVAINRTQPYAETNVTMPTFKQFVADHPSSSSSSSNSSGSPSSGSSSNSDSSSDSSDSSGSGTSGKAVSGASGALSLRPASAFGLTLMLLAVLSLSLF